VTRRAETCVWANDLPTVVTPSDAVKADAMFVGKYGLAIGRRHFPAGQHTGSDQSVAAAISPAMLIAHALSTIASRHENRYGCAPYPDHSAGRPPVDAFREALSDHEQLVCERPS